LSNNPAVNMEFVMKYIDKPWCWGNGGLSSNPAITMDFVETHIDKPWVWRIGGLSNNPFTFNIHTEAAIKIQRACHNWLWAPKCKDGTIGLMVKKMLRDIVY
jgi:hypothetical protein